MSLKTSLAEEITYPSSDGKPMADNTIQARWIITLYNNLSALFAGQEVFVAADLLWYPVEGQPRLCAAPDVMLAFGRPAGDRMSYLQWKEDNVAPQVVFEVLSPSNTPMEMLRKQQFYQKYGVEEFIVIDPGREETAEKNFLVYQREGEHLQEVSAKISWTSPRMGIRLELAAGKIQLFYPDGSPFRSYAETKSQWEAAEKAREVAEKAREKEAQARQVAEKARQAAEEKYTDSLAEIERLRGQLKEKGDQ